MNTFYKKWANLPVEHDINSKFGRIYYGIRNLPFEDKDAKKGPHVFNKSSYNTGAKRPAPNLLSGLNDYRRRSETRAAS